MPQETNFNVSPYFDDFDKDKEYYRVLFKPGLPVQARELTTSQSILQNQVEQLGKKFFKDGEIVIPGTLAYENPIYAVEIEPTFNGLPISLYFNSLRFKKIKGSQSGVTAEIIQILNNEESERKNYTLYVKYLESGGDNFDIKRFQDGEILILLDTISYGENLRFTVQKNQGFANTLPVNSSSEGSAVSISEGTAFVRGIFANIKNQTLILDQYGSSPSYKIGFDILERVVTADEDDSLYDNARSFSNYTSPGADRFKIELILSKKDINQVEIDNFVELMRVTNGVPEFPIKNETKPYNVVKNEVAKSLADSSGDFYIKPFTVYARDSLNDRVLTDGIYFENQTTVLGNTPSEDNLVYQIGPGKAYVNGYEVETTSARLLDAPKPRTTNECIKELLPYNAGNLFVLNNTLGSPYIGLGTDTTVSLLDSRLSTNKVATGTTIGVARVYDYIPESNYENESSRMHLRLYDIQTYTTLTFTKSAAIKRPTYIEGKKSNASGYSLDYSLDNEIDSITFPTTGIGTIYFDQESLSGIATIITASQVAHGLNVNDKVFISGTGQELLDYQNNGTFTVLSTTGVVVPYFDVSLGIATTSTVPNGTAFTVQLPGGVAPEDPSTIIGLGNFTNSTAQVTVNSTGHPFKTGDEVYIENTSNIKFNNNFIVTNLSGNTFRLNGVTALNYYNGPVSAVNGDATLGISTIRLYQVSGRFTKGELLTFNGLDNDSRILKEVVDYSISDIKSIYSDSVVGISTFAADLELAKVTSIAPPGTIFRITNGLSGVSTISSSTFFNFAEFLKEGDIISYSNPFKVSNTLPTYNKVSKVNVNGKEIEVVAISTVSGVADGALYTNISNPSDYYDSTNIIKISPSVYGSRNSESFMTRLSYPNVASLDLENNTLTQRRLFTNVAFSNRTLNVDINPEDTDVYFASFDEDRYVITYSNGKKEIIRFDKFNVSNNGKRVTFVDLTNSPSSSGFADVIVTVINYKPNSKIKKLNRVSTLTVSNSKYDYSGTGDGTKDDGLTYSRVYGTRVQDKEISLNVPDAIRVLAIYESTSTNDPQLPRIQVNQNTSDIIVGEQFVGEQSGFVGLVVKKIGTDLIEYVYLNSFPLQNGENVVFKESNKLMGVLDIFQSDKNITQNYSFDNGQRSTYYDYSRIIKKKNSNEPERKIKVVFQNYTVDSSDTGEIFTINSYSTSGFKHDIPTFDSSRVSDYIDIRPRVSPYTLNQYSPFEFNQRNFTGDGQYSKYILAPGENLQVCYKHYLGRIDKICLKPNGSFEVIQGVPSTLPLAPSLSDNCLDVATINLPPYIFNINSIEVDVTKHKKYTMKDISSLEDRIRKLEEYTILNSLETQTENLTLKDAETGLDRFKCGFFADSFINTDLQDFSDPNNKVSIDTKLKTLRPTHYTTALDMQLGSEVILGISNEFDQSKDHDFVTNLGSINVRKTGDLITLNYSDVLYFEQPYATRTESVTPFLVKYWTGTIELRPPLDSWVEEREVVNRLSNEKYNILNALPDINISTTNDVVENKVVFRENVNTRTGVANNIWITNRSSVASLNLWWNSFRTRNSSALNSSIVTSNGRRVVRFRAFRKRLDSADQNYLRSVLPEDIANSYITQVQSSGVNQAIFLEFSPNFTTTTTDSSTTTSVQTVSNTTTTTIPPDITVGEDSVSESVSNFTEPIRYLRSRNIEFDVKGLRPRTRFYSFFEGIDVSSYIIPKLLEIDMISGRFEIGETVETDPHFTASKIRFRVCKPNHKSGPFASPVEKFNLIPYTQQSPPDNYTESSSYLNVDTRSLELSSEVDYYGQISVDMKIIGKTSGAVARVKTNRLISDNVGRLIGSLFIPDPKIPGNPKWINGENTFTIIDVPSLASVSSNDKNVINESSAEKDFTSTANTNVTEKTILTTRNYNITPSRNVNTTVITNTTTNTTTVTQSTTQTNFVNRWEVRDPLAQSFYVPDETGIFLTGVDVYFESVDDSIPVTLQIRTMIAGVPSNVVIPFSEVTLVPDEINVSTNGILPTRFRFSSPVYLPGPKPQEVRGAPIASEQTAEYAIVLLSNSANYRVFIAQLGENDILTNIKVGSQPTLGSLFKSQNGTTWTPSQLQDLKYKIYRADFANQGVVRYFNPVLSLKNNKVSVLGENQIQLLSKKLALKTNIEPKSNVVPGVTIYQNNRSQGKLIGIGGSISTGLGVTISSVGTGYTPASGTYTFEDKVLITETGLGSGAIADIVVTDGIISGVNIVNGGFGYQIGDSLLVPNVGQDVGFGAKVSVSNLSFKNTLFLDNITVIESDFSVGVELLYINEVGISSQVGVSTENSTFAVPTQIISDNYYDGQHLKINCLNHGMHSSQNYVRISNLRPERDSLNTKLIQPLSSNETTSINVDSTIGFEQFEGFNVDESNPGYIIIGSEVVGYTTVSNSTTLGGLSQSIQRGIDGSESQAYDSGILVYKYELNGISLRRINKVHSLLAVDEEIHPTTFNSFHVKIESGSDDFESNPIGFSRGSAINFKNTKSVGESGTLVSNNIPFELITPNFATIVPSETSLSARVRTFSGTSIDGDETSYEDQGYDDISLETTKQFDSPRLVASAVNESRLIEGSPGNRSLTIELNMTTNDSRVSPVIDDVTTSIILTSNIINAPAGVKENSTFADVEYVRGSNDEHECVYISKPISLKLPANSLKVLMKGFTNEDSDIRVLYKLIRTDSNSDVSNFELFPGYSNYQVDSLGVKRVIDPSRNDGSSDRKIVSTSEEVFDELEYTVDNLPEFNAYAIKIIMASKNQAKPPLIKSLRAIATLKPQI